MDGHGLVGGRPLAIGGCVSKSESAWRPGLWNVNCAFLSYWFTKKALLLSFFHLFGLFACLLACLLVGAYDNWI